MAYLWKTKEDIQEIFDPIKSDDKPRLEWMSHLNRDTPSEYQTPFWKDKIHFAEGTSDTPENHEKICKNIPDWWEFKKPESITYKLNKEGFRCPMDFDKINWKDVYVIMGCSHVFGVGNAMQDTIGEQIHYRTGKHVINLGVPGGNNDVIFNNAMKLLQDYGKPKKLFVLWTYWDRWTHIEDYYFPNEYGLSGWYKRVDIQPGFYKGRFTELKPPIARSWLTDNIQQYHRKLMYKTALRNIFLGDLVEMEVDKLLVLGDEKLGLKGPDVGNVDKVYYKFPDGMTEVNRYQAEGSPKHHPRYYWEKIPEAQKAWYLNNIKARDIIEYDPAFGIKPGHGHYGRIPNKHIGDKFVSKSNGNGDWLT